MSEPPDGQDVRPMAGDTAESVASGAMDASHALDDAPGPPEPLTLEPVPDIDESDVAPVSLAQRLRQPRTILSIVVPLAIIAFFLYLNRDRLSAVPDLILHANPALVLLAFIVFYLGFPLRGYRWARLLRQSAHGIQ